jgi:hypothetical protein
MISWDEAATTKTRPPNSAGQTGVLMKREIVALIDWSRGVWVVQYRDRVGEMIVEPTAYPANTPSIVVSDELQKERPEFAVFAKIN